MIVLFCSNIYLSSVSLSWTSSWFTISGFEKFFLLNCVNFLILLAYGFNFHSFASFLYLSCLSLTYLILIFDCLIWSNFGSNGDYFPLVMSMWIGVWKRWDHGNIFCMEGMDGEWKICFSPTFFWLIMIIVFALQVCLFIFGFW